MAKFYKTTHLDGSSWHDPEFVYREGHTYRPRRGTKADSYRVCTNGVLHACSTPEKAASVGWGTKWPFLLWSFEGTPIVEGCNTYGFRQIGPMVAEDVGLCFGPNGRQVVKLLKLLAVATTYQRYMTEGMAPRGARHDARDVTWRAARHIARCAAYESAQSIAWSIDWTVDRINARYVARDAIGALVVADLVGQYRLGQRHVDTLLQPMVNVFGNEWLEKVDD